MQIFDITVPAGSPFVVHAPGKYIKYLSGNNGGGDTRLSITPGMSGGSKITLVPGQAYRVADDAKKPDSWTLANYAGGAAIFGQVVVGDGKIDDNSIAGTVQVVDGGKARTLANSAYIGMVQVGSVTGQYGRLQLWNPASNPNRLVVEQMTVNTSGTAGAGAWLQKSTAQLATLFQMGQPKRLDGNASTCGMYTDTTAAATATAPTLANLVSAGVGYQAIHRPNEPYVVMPGTGLLLWGNQTAVVIAASFEWYEEPNV